MMLMYSSLLYKVHDRLLSQTEAHISELMAMERSQIWTENEHFMVSSKQRFVNRLTLELCGSSTGTVSEADNLQKLANGYTASQSIARALACLSLAGVVLTEEEERALARKHQGAADDASLLELIAGTLAYYKVSSKRVIDGVPMHLRHYLLQRFCRELEQLPAKLAAGLADLHATDGAAAGSMMPAGYTVAAGSNSALGADDEDDSKQQCVGAKAYSTAQPVVVDAARLMAEDESTAERRAQLHGQLKKLQEVRMILSVF